MKSFRTRGFTLIELMISITIIAIITGATIAALNIARQNARDAKRLALVEQTALAIESYRQAGGAYPASWNQLIPLYISESPKDPRTDTEYPFDTTFVNKTCNGISRAVLEIAVEREKGANELCGNTLGDLMYVSIVGSPL